MIVLIYFFCWVIYLMNVPKMLHIMQLESYQVDGFFRWITKNPKKAFKNTGIQFLSVIGMFFLTTFTLLILKNLSMQLGYTALIIQFSLITITFFVANTIILSKDKKERATAKKPLKYTARAKRLYLSNFFIMIILETAFSEFMGIGLNSTIYETNYIEYLKRIIIMYSFFIFTIPLNMILANGFIHPTEEWINERYINKARRILKKKEYKDLIKIGITGSYGKTSTKFILEKILSEKYNVLATPNSYNTTMGNVRVIREQLKPEHQVFISEMGARKINDIKEICEFVHPDIGIITSIGPQHLETFKKIENVVKTKKELIDGLSEKGIAILPKDNEHCFNIYKEEQREKYLYSLSDRGSDVYAKDIKVSPAGSTFKVVTKNGEFECTTKLLGEHNVQNILGCIAIAVALELTNEEIKAGVSKIEPIEHRLQILPTNNGTTVIDDAFNSNPVGSKMALDIVKKFEGRKIIITPGMVELGAEEEILNKEFGKQIGNSMDIAILVGTKRTEPIAEGIKETKFDQMNIFVVPTLEEATKKLGSLTRAGDVILFENDLPDNYNE
ncbi:MAG: UDP-N-acetylmuramoyl-tripeptide--D-alanyl-D-alanine ligase [Clostridia bacterium]|nr:UDP-N-acetylmuramoyl-tripeptide--D-alanyl-D-alanine ligase [Clostridia bacterium]